MSHRASAFLLRASAAHPEINPSPSVAPGETAPASHPGSTRALASPGPCPSLPVPSAAPARPLRPALPLIAPVPHPRLQSGPPCWASEPESPLCAGPACHPSPAVIPAAPLLGRLRKARAPSSPSPQPQCLFTTCRDHSELCPSGTEQATAVSVPGSEPGLAPGRSSKRAER